MFQERIRANYEKLSPGYRKLADFIVSHTLDAAFLTATELSRRVGVDPATVVRFAQELGYSGYRELSREIKHHVRDQVTATYRKTTEAQTEEDLLRALVEDAQQNLQHFVTTEMRSLAQALQILRGAAKIWLAGEYAAYQIAGAIAKNLEIIGVPAVAFHPSMMETASAVSMMQEGDVLVALAIGNAGLDTGYAVKMAREKGIKTVCLSEFGVALPAREADLTVTIPAQSATGTPSFGVSLLLLALLWEGVASQQAELTAERYSALQDYMTQLLNLRAQTPEYDVASPQSIWTAPAE
jgi:DNA-binding MurR/RpiR family transcriptional regulator